MSASRPQSHNKNTKSPNCETSQTSTILFPYLHNSSSVMEKLTNTPELLFSAAEVYTIHFGTQTQNGSIYQDMSASQRSGEPEGSYSNTTTAKHCGIQGMEVQSACICVILLHITQGYHKAIQYTMQSKSDKSFIKARVGIIKLNP